MPKVKARRLRGTKASSHKMPKMPKSMMMRKHG